MKKRESAFAPLLAALQTVSERLVTCGICGNVDTHAPCAICADPRRDPRSLCVVEEVSDLWALDKSRLFPGKYHVLGGRLSALEGIRPQDLSIDALVARVAAGGIVEVVDRKGVVVGKGVSVRVGLGGGRIIKKKKD